MDALHVYISAEPLELSTTWPQTPTKQTILEKVLHYFSVLSIDDNVTKLSYEEVNGLRSQKNLRNKIV